VCNLTVPYIEDVVNVVFLAPFDEVVEHEDGLVHFELASAQEPQQVVVIVLRVIRDAVVLDVLPELLQSSFLVLTHVSHKTTGRKY
jgi:hypothetical protein